MDHRSSSILLVSLALGVLPAAAQEGAEVPRTRSDAPAPMRAQTDRRAQPFDDIVVLRDVVYAEAKTDDGRTMELKLDTAFLKRSNGQPMPVVVYIHGGGWRAGSKELGGQFLLTYARGGYFAVSIAYRLADDARYPAAVHDCKAAIRFLRAHADELEIDGDRIGVWGHSAGGHLSALLATSGNSDVLEGEVGVGDVSSAVTCAASVSGPSDFSVGLGTRGGRIVRYWLGDGDGDTWDRTRAIEASPVTYIDASDPPTLIVHGTADPLVPIDQAERFERALAAAGVSCTLYVVDGGGHGIREPRAYARLAQFFDEHLKGDVIGVLRGQRPKARPGTVD